MINLNLNIEAEKERERKAYNRAYYLANKEKLLGVNAIYQKTHRDQKLKNAKKYRDSHKEQARAYYLENKEKFNLYRKEYRENNKENSKNYPSSQIEWRREYYKKNKEIINKRVCEYRKKNKDKINSKYNNRLKTDPLFKLTVGLRTRTRIAFKRMGIDKTTKTEHLLGAKWNIVKLHIESLFRDGMNWENHGKWHIDHIIPLSSANSDTEVIKLCHYTNLQPLWANDNYKKGNKIQRKVI